MRHSTLIEFDQFSWTADDTIYGGDRKIKLIKRHSFYKTPTEYAVLLGGTNMGSIFDQKFNFLIKLLLPATLATKNKEIMAKNIFFVKKFFVRTEIAMFFHNFDF